MYAWSRFAKTIDEWGRVKSWIEPGDEISQDDIGVDNDEWKELQDAGAVRKEAYPDIPDNMSPAEYFRANPDAAPEVEPEPEPEPEPEINHDDENSGANDLFGGGGVTK